jgi:hypothetical protein
MKRLLLILVALALVAIPATASASPVRHCSVTNGQGPRDDSGIPFGSLTVRNLTCSAARAAIRNGYLGQHLNAARFHTRGFSCRVTREWRQPGLLTGQTIHCTQWINPPGNSRAFQWSWAT